MLPVSLAIYQTSDFQRFYTDASEINSLMQWLLGPVDGLRLLEPCAGRGALILGLHGVPALVDAIDIDTEHIAYLVSKKISWLRTIHADFVDNHICDSPSDAFPLRRDYDAVICNPPYGLRFSVSYRKLIKKRFPNLYARESYGLFMYFAIRALRASGRYVFVVPDTFLTSRNHRSLREFISAEGCPSHIIRFHSKRFKTVNFGYGSLCIIAGNRRPLQSSDKVLWVDAPNEEKEVTASLFTEGESVSGSFLQLHVSDGWVNPTKREAIALACPSTSLGMVAECRTGVYTGNNVRFCGYDSQQPPPRAKNGHPIIWSDQVRLTPLSEEEEKRGLDGVRCYVPFIRGGHRLPFAQTVWALNWSKDAVNFYGSDKKSRLQNSQFYFRRGLAIPMVTSGRISASLIEAAIFDQGAVGVFPQNPEWLEFMLLYINSDFVSRTVKSVLSPGANNSANYIKKIPIPIPSQRQLEEAKEIVCQARAVGWDEISPCREEFITNIIQGGTATKRDSSSNQKGAKIDRPNTALINLLENR